jgi:hypothetical protein
LTNSSSEQPDRNRFLDTVTFVFIHHPPALCLELCSHAGSKPDVLSDNLAIMCRSRPRRHGSQPFAQSVGDALVTSACNAEMARVRDWIACAPVVVSSTRVASRSPAPRLAEADPGECLPGRSRGADVVTSRRTTGGPLRTDVNDPLAANQQRRGQSDPVAAGAFDGPQRRVLTLPEGHQLAVPDRIGGNREVIQNRAGRTDRRRGVGVFVGVDADDDTKISLDSELQFTPWPEVVTLISTRATLRQDCDESHPKGGQASDQANPRQPSPVPTARRTSPNEGTTSGLVEAGPLDEVLVPKGARRIGGLSDMIISLYSGGMTPPKLVEGAIVQGWNQAYGALSIAFPGRLDRRL